MKKLAVKVTEQGNKITLTFDSIQAQKSVRDFDPENSAPKVHSVKKGKGSYNRKEKHKGREEDKDPDLCFLIFICRQINRRSFYEGICLC